MAIYRQIHTTFWKDRRVGEWDKDQKLFYLYLLTNDYTTQCGVYEFNRRYAEFELGMSREQVDSHIKFLVSEGRIVFNEKPEELMIVNWLKYNSARSPKVAAVIDKELREIKTLEFESEVIKKCQLLEYPIKTKEPKKDSISIEYGYGIDTISQPTHNQQQHITNTETAVAEQGVREAQPEATATAAECNPYFLYQQSFGVLNSTTSEDISHWVEDLGAEVVCEAMKRAAYDQKGYRYAQGIMRSWANRNITTLEQVAADDVRYENNKRQQQQSRQNYGKPYKTESVTNWDEVAPPVEADPALEAELDRQLAEFYQESDSQ